MGKADARRELKGCRRLLALLLLAACLNPRPEELPSALEPAPGGASDPTPTAAAAADDGSNTRAAEPVGDPGGDDTASPESAPPPEPPSVLDAPEPHDAGAEAGPSSDAPADAGDADAG